MHHETKTNNQDGEKLGENQISNKNPYTLMQRRRLAHVYKINKYPVSKWKGTYI